MDSSPDLENAEHHRAFLDRYYGATHRIYDLSRKYYLFGRDTLIEQLSREAWSTLVEVGPGTGRNLRHLHTRCPQARLGGVEASTVMRNYARRRCPWAKIDLGFAEDGDIRAVLGEAPDRILFSYSLSMFQDPEAAIHNARTQLAPGGSLVVVDFSDFGDLPAILRASASRFLAAFHVRSVDDALLRASGATSLDHGFGRYFVQARFAALTP